MRERPMTTEVPEPIPFDPDNPPADGELPELPLGMHWELRITAEAEVVHPDGTTS